MKILFVCNGNVARSQEAELFFNTLKQDAESVAISGGINVKLGKPIDPLVIDVMKEIGYDISGARRKFVDEEMVKGSDMIISFKPQSELPAYLRNNETIRFWDIADPQHQSVDFHRQIRDDVKLNVSEFIGEMGLYKK